jgi:hypothetical protein
VVLDGTLLALELGLGGISATLSGSPVQPRHPLCSRRWRRAIWRSSSEKGETLLVMRNIEPERLSLTGKGSHPATRCRRAPQSLFGKAWSDNNGAGMTLCVGPEVCLVKRYLYLNDTVQWGVLASNCGFRADVTAHLTGTPELAPCFFKRVAEGLPTGDCKRGRPRQGELGRDKMVTCHWP